MCTKDMLMWTKDMHGTRVRVTKWAQGKNERITHKIIIISEPNVLVQLLCDDIMHLHQSEQERKLAVVMGGKNYQFRNRAGQAGGNQHTRVRFVQSSKKTHSIWRPWETLKNSVSPWRPWRLTFKRHTRCLMTLSRWHNKWVLQHWHSLPSQQKQCAWMQTGI
jgi:hypothetical protein